MTRQVRYGIVAGVVLVLAVILLVLDKGLWAAGLVLLGVLLVGADYMMVSADEDIERESVDDQYRRTGDTRGVGTGGGSGTGGGGGGGGFG